MCDNPVFSTSPDLLEVSGMVSSEKNLRLILLVFVLVSLFTYALLTELFQILVNGGSLSDSLTRAELLTKLSSIIVAVFMFFLTLRSKFITKILLGRNYIQGTYVGSSEILDENKEVLGEHKEEIKISQSIFQTVISGSSGSRSSKNNQLGYSNYNGKLVEIENDKYRFLIRVETPKDQYIDVLSLSITDGKATGFITASSARKPKRWMFNLTKSERN